MSMSGVSVTVGRPGASVSFGKRGVYSNLGIPGTGLSYRARLDSPRRKPPAASSSPTLLQVSLRLEESGDVSIVDSQGNPLDNQHLAVLRQQKSELIRNWLADEVEKLNTDYEACVGVYRLTPAPTSLLSLDPSDEELGVEPQRPLIAPIRFVDRLLFRAKAKEGENRRLLDRYQEALTNWIERRSEVVERLETCVELAARGNPEAMHSLLERKLATIRWPRETQASFDFGNDGGSLEIDVDLPEIEDISTRVAAVAGRGFRVDFKDRSPTQLRRDYQRLINGTIFRILGEAFSCLPTLGSVTASGFTQRVDPGTGTIRDDYVLSVRVERADWETLSFTRLEDLDPAEALTRFELVRQTDRSGNLKTIRPLGRL